MGGIIYSYLRIAVFSVKIWTTIFFLDSSSGYSLNLSHSGKPYDSDKPDT